MSAHSKPRIYTFKAGADLSEKQYHFVKFGSSDEEVVLCDTAGEKVLGVLMNKPASGELAEVALPGGGAKVKTAGVIARGNHMSTDANGQAVAAAVAAGNTYAAAMAMATSASGDIIPAEVMSFMVDKT